MPGRTSDETVEAVARAIFKAQQDFDVFDGDRLPDRHFKVAISLYRVMADAAIKVLASDGGLKLRPFDLETAGFIRLRDFQFAPGAMSMKSPTMRPSTAWSM